MNTLTALQGILNPIDRQIYAAPTNLELAGVKTIRKAIKYHPYNINELVRITKLGKTSLYQKLKWLIDAKEVHCTEGKGKYYAAVDVKLPDRKNPAQELLRQILAYLSEPRTRSEILHYFKNHKEGTIIGHLRSLRGQNGFPTDIKLVRGCGYYSRINT